MKYVLFLFMFTTPNAHAILPGDVPDLTVCDEQAYEIEWFFQKLDSKLRVGAEEICFNAEEMMTKKYPRSSLSPKRQNTVKGIVRDLCIDFELASCVDYSASIQ